MGVYVNYRTQRKSRQMDTTGGRLVDYAMGTKFSDLPDEVVHECKRRLIDTFACAVGAHDAPLSQMTRAVAKRYTGTPSASVWGCSWETSVETAAFANGGIVSNAAR